MRKLPTHLVRLVPLLLLAACEAAPADPAKRPDPFADRVVAFAPGPGATFGHSKLPGVVLGPPKGNGAGAGGLDVVSLGAGGQIVLAMDDLAISDGPGPDFLVFENAFVGFADPATVEVSQDGATWFAFPCDPGDAAAGYPGCAGVTPVFSHPANGISATDPALAGGDTYDLAELGLASARFVRLTDCLGDPAQAPSAGFDLDAIAAIHTAPLSSASSAP